MKHSESCTLTHTLFAGPGELRALCRARDWSATPLGAVETWPTCLRTVASLVLATPTPMIALWGPDLVQLYNDGYREVMGTKHPGGLGQRNIECWPEVWDFTGPIYEGVFRGESFTFTDQPLVLERYGQPDEGFFTLAYSPVLDEACAVGGILVTVFETTAQVRAAGERELERERLLAESEAANSQLRAQTAELEHANQLLQDQAMELELQTDALEIRAAAAEAAALALGESETRHRLAVDAAQLGTWTWNVATDTVRFDARARELFGFESDDAQPRLRIRADHVHPDDRELVNLAHAHAIDPAGDGRYDVEFRAVRPDGSERWISVAGVMRFEGEGAARQPLSIVGTVMDITQRKHVEEVREETAAEQQRFAAVLKSMTDAFYLLDRDWRFTHVNDSAEPLLQTTRESLLGRTLWEAFPGVIGSPFEGPYREAMAAGHTTSAEAYFPPLGTWFDVRTYPWAGGLMVHFRDIGARKAAEAEREQLLADAQAARTEAETASRVKSEFLAVMSHELRTPLNAIGGHAELIELGIHGPVTAEQRDALARIQRSQRSLLGLINGVLNYARVEAGAVRYELENVPLDEVLTTCEALVAPQSRSKGLTLRLEPCDLRLTARADREKVQQIVLNLLSNALKFTEPGGRIALASASDEDGHVMITVSDSGQGIAADQVDRVFQPFVQLDAKLTRVAEGTGLGLSISRDLAHGMGGDLTVVSALGRGSVFTLTLPRA